MEVHDSSMLTQMVQQVQQGAQELQTLQRQLQTLQQRVQQGHELYQSLTGARGMDQVAGLLNNPTVRSALPDNTSALLASMQSVVSSYGSISGLAQQIRQGSQIVSYPGKDWYQQEVNRIGDRHAAEMAVAQQIYQTAVPHSTDCASSLLPPVIQPPWRSCRPASRSRRHRASMTCWR
jgi:Type IV secretion system proteins